MFDVLEKVVILRSFKSSIEKKYSHDELMDLNEVTDLINSIFRPVIMSDITEYWKDLLCICDSFFLFIHGNHCTNAFPDLLESQQTMPLWLKIHDNDQYSCWLPYFWLLLTNLPRNRERFLEENYPHSLNGNQYFEMN